MLINNEFAQPASNIAMVVNITVLDTHNNTQYTCELPVDTIFKPYLVNDII